MYGFHRERAFVERHVLVCQTPLVEFLLSGNTGSSISEDDIANLYDDSIDAIEAFLADHFPEDDWHELPFDERELLATRHGFAAEPHEIYEWWLVTPYMARALKQFGQPVLWTDYGIWWGRTCTGQAIHLDHVITQCVES